MLLKQRADRELIENFQIGCDTSFEILLKRHKTRIFSYILMVVRNRDFANDIFQNTFIDVINGLKQGKYTEENKFLPWALRIAHNNLMDHFRLQKRLPISGCNFNGDIFETIHCTEPTIEEQFLYENFQKNIKLLIEYLPSDLKEIIIMKHYYEMTFAEIAEELNISVNTATGRMRYALRKLRKMIKKKKISITI